MQPQGKKPTCTATLAPPLHPIIISRSAPTFLLRVPPSVYPPETGGYAMQMHRGGLARFSYMERYAALTGEINRALVIGRIKSMVIGLRLSAEVGVHPSFPFLLF